MATWVSPINSPFRHTPPLLKEYFKEHIPVTNFTTVPQDDVYGFEI
jgi:hypothetical protein